MYNSYFGFDEPPFNNTPDSRFLYESEDHTVAFNSLLYGIRERKGFILLTGEIGSGKTTICRALVNILRSEGVHLALILNPSLDELELLKAINHEFGQPDYYDTKKGLTDALNTFLLVQHQQHANVCLIIDEAQTLSPNMLEQIRMLSNLETEDSKLLQIVLIGQPELRTTLERPDLEQLNQRIGVRYHINPLSRADLPKYIEHRMRVANAKVQIQFSPEAIDLAYEKSKGIPRRLNNLCDRGLLAAYADASHIVDKARMQKAVVEVMGSLEAETRSSSRIPKLVSERGLSPKTQQTLLWVMVSLCVVGLIFGSMAVGVTLARWQAERADSQLFVQTETAMDSEGLDDNQDAGDGEVTADATPTPTPSPTPDWEALRQRQPNWKYEERAPLVRVNEPRFTRRAAEFSVLRAWGLSLNLRETAEAGEEFLVSGALSAPGIGLIEVPLNDMDLSRAVRLNVPLILRLKDRKPNLSEWVVLLRSEGEASTIGDPIWGPRGMMTAELRTHFDRAIAIGIDQLNLRRLTRGERSPLVTDLQSFLRSFLKGSTNLELTGTYDAATTEAIQAFQTYFGLPNTGQLDSLTVILLNARMMTNGPRLNAAALR
jgi:type II secretory pathway predicted ATPase ExeA